MLADPSRHSVYEDLVRGSGSATICEIAERLDLHPNTVRLHLEKLREAGLVESAPDRHGSVGRPHLVWTVRWFAPSLGLEPSGMRMLAHLLGDLAAMDPDASEHAEAAGRRRGSELSGAAAAGDRPSRGAARSAGSVQPALDELASLGFDPTLETSGGRQMIAFGRCPFRELAVIYPDLICQLHKGITAAVVADHGVSLEGFSTLVDPDPCRAEVSINS